MNVPDAEVLVIDKSIGLTTKIDAPYRTEQGIS